MQYFYDIIFNFLLLALIHAYACAINNICHTVTTVIYDGYDRMTDIYFVIYIIE